MQHKDSFCLMPWIHLHVSTRGLAQACCISPITFGDINQQSIEAIWNGDKIKSLRRKMLNGEKDKRCRGCYDREASGKSSIRTETLEKFESYIDQCTSEDTSLHPIYLDIRFSNVCNFRCVTCWHGASSKWFEEARVKGTNVSDQAIIKAIDDEDNFFDQIESFTPSLEEIYLAGGEPLVTEEHYRLLKLLINKGKDVHLRYNTNLSLLSFKTHDVIDYWKQFTNVTVSASIDAAGQLGEEIRRDSDWSAIVSNMKRIKEECPHVNLEIAPTVSSLNILKIPELHQTLHDYGLIAIDGIYFNLLHRPAEFNCKNATNKEDIKKAFDDYNMWLISSKASKNTIHEAKKIIDFMYSA